MGLALVHRNSADRERGLELLAQVRDMCMQDRFMLTEVAIADVYAAQGKAKHGDLDGAVRQLQEVLNDLFEERQTWS
jgi:adenylate cyclase